MDARWMRLALLGAVLCGMGASSRTQNFIIEAPTAELAEAIGRAAEQYRRDLAIEWLGSAMPNWSRPCPIVAKVDDKLGAGGATSFVFDSGEVFDWKMNIQGSRERVLDSVLPHEVTHTIFASYFRRPLPRWADEGACTTVEHDSERSKQQRLLIQFLQTGKGIAFNQLFAMKEYPREMLPLYAEGYSLARFLIDQKGRREFVSFLTDGLKTDNWPAATHKHYAFADLSELQTVWLDWVKRGSPLLTPQDRSSALAQNDASRTSNPDVIYRGQSEDPVSPAGTNGLASVPMPQTRQSTGPLAGGELPLVRGAAPNSADRSRYNRTSAERIVDDFTPADSAEARNPADPSLVSTAGRVLFEWRKGGAAE